MAPEIVQSGYVKNPEVHEHNMSVEIPEAYRGLFNRSRYKVYYGGRGSARSWSFARALLIISLMKPTRILCAREFQTSIADSVHRLLSDQIQMLGLSHLFSITRREIISVNGSMFLFKGLHHNIVEIKSLEGITIAWVEEAEKVSQQSWDILIPTIRDKDSEIWINFNPGDSRDPTYQNFVESAPDDAIVKHTTWRDNPFFPEALARERDRMWRVDPERAKHIWDGYNRTRSDAQVFNGKWILDYFEAKRYWDGPYFGVDWGFAQDPAVMVRCWINESCLWIDYESSGIGVEIDNLPHLFSKVPLAPDHVIRADSARPETINYCKRFGFPKMKPARKWPNCVEEGVEFMRSFDKIIIHPRCKRTANEIQEYRYKVDRLTDEVLPQLVDLNNHCIDSLRYALDPLIKGKSKRAGAW